MKPSKQSLERDLEHAMAQKADIVFRLTNGAHLMTYSEVQALKASLATISNKCTVLARKVSKAS